jgi:histidine triad (HIT) family protein
LATIFTKILNNEIPCYKIAENENCFAFLDINPNTIGHTLCIPKKEEDYIFDLDSKSYNDLMDFSKKIALAIKKAIPCKRVSMVVIGLEVPHAHVHLIPINDMKDIGFKNKTKCSNQELEKIAYKIKSFL